MYQKMQRKKRHNETRPCLIPGLNCKIRGGCCSSTEKIKIDMLGAWCNVINIFYGAIMPETIASQESRSCVILLAVQLLHRSSFIYIHRWVMQLRLCCVCIYDNILSHRGQRAASVGEAAGLALMTKVDIRHAIVKAA